MNCLHFELILFYCSFIYCEWSFLFVIYFVLLTIHISSLFSLINSAALFHGTYLYVTCQFFSRQPYQISSNHYLKYYYLTSVEIFWFVMLQFIRFLRRSEGVEAARKYFVDARKSPNCTYHVYVAYAMMAFCLDKDAKVIRTILISNVSSNLVHGTCERLPYLKEYVQNNLILTNRLVYDNFILVRWLFVELFDVLNQITLCNSFFSNQFVYAS